MSEMIERVAEAVYRSQEWDFASDEQFADLTNGAKEIFRISARAAIEAMREPTNDMKTCSDEVHWGYGCHVCGGLTEGWHKMIGAALVKVDA